MRAIPGQIPLWVGLALAIAAVPGCRSGAPGQAPPALRIGAVVDSPPLVFREHGRWQGVEADLARAWADRLGVQPVFIAVAPDQQVAALLDGQVDVLMSGLAITAERRVRMDFASPYLVVGQAALVRAEELLRYNTEIKIRSTRARVGVVVDSPGDRLVSRYFTNAARTVFPRAGNAIAALRQGQIDMVIFDAPAAWWFARQPGVPALALAPALFAREEVAWAFRRGSATLRDSANQALADWQRDGTLEAILQRWIPFSK